MAQLYGVATYAVGANEQCDRLDQGEYRGLVVLRDALTPDLYRATTSEVFTSLKHASTGTTDWATGCLARITHVTDWRRIDSARLMTHVLQEGLVEHTYEHTSKIRHLYVAFSLTKKTNKAKL